MNRMPEIISHVIKLEGGDKYTNHPLDPGGHTKYGITLRTLKRWYKHKGRNQSATKADVKALTKPEAVQIYEAFYWSPVKAGQLPQPLQWVMFDAAVNQGVGQAGKFLQRACNRKLKIDGQIGPKTLAAMKAHQPYELATEVCVRRALHYTALHHWLTFGKGWMRRLFNIHREAMR